MVNQIVLNPNGNVTPLRDVEGDIWAILVEDGDTIPGAASIVSTGLLGETGFPVNVQLPQWAIDSGSGRIQTLLHNGTPGPEMVAGANLISQVDVGFAAGSTFVWFYYRPAGIEGQYGPWRKRILRAPEEQIIVPTPTERLILSGPLTYSTNGEVGSALTITAIPSASRTPSSTETVLRLYSALTGGTLNSTVSPIPTTVPNNPTLFGVPVYRAYDSVYNEWVEVEASARFDIVEPAISPAAVVQGDLTITAAWKPGGLRQQAIHTFTCAGSPHGTLLQARIDTEPYTTGWVDCVEQVTSNVWGFPVAPIPSGVPGAGRNAFEFYDMIDRYRIKFRRRANSGVAWSATSGNLVFPMPTTGGAEEFNSLPTTRAALQTAIATGMASGSGRYVIGLSGNIDFGGGTVSVSNLTKPGEPLIIKSVSRSTPVILRGITGRAFELTLCNNVMFDRIEIRNDRTAPLGWPAGKVPNVNYPTGAGYRFYGCTKIHIADCLLKDIRTGIFLRDCDDIWIGFCEFDGIVEDGIRMYTRNGNVIIEGEYQHDPNVYSALANSNVSPSHHPDDTQLATSVQSTWYRPAGNRLGGNRNIKRLRGRSYGMDVASSYHTSGFWGNEVMRPPPDANLNPNDTNMDTGGARHVNANIVWDGMYVETTHDMCPHIEVVDGAIFRNSVFRKTGTRTPRLKLLRWAKNVTIENYVTPGPLWLDPGSASPGRMTVAELQAGVTGNVTQSLTAWPTGWTGGETRYPTGPDDYR